jgi:molybdopterin synthase catalytic subunit/molybdopterin converting factor small subunit
MSNVLQIHVELMGRAAVDAGARSLELELPHGATARDACERLVADRPALHWLRRVARPAVNRSYVSWEHPLADGDEVAFIPPVSGGSSPGVGCLLAEITERPLDVAVLARRVARPEAGAIATFAGVVRNHARGRRVLYLEYDAYRSMAESEMRKIALEAAARWECCVAVQHRVGRLEIGEASVAVAVSSAHRAAAFEACRYVIDTLKETVPIWKKEVWEGGEVWIEGDGESASQPTAEI